MAKSKSVTRRNLTVLFTCIGRRVSLLNSFRRAARQLKREARFIGVDTTNLSSALQLCDKHFLVKPVGHPDYIRHLLEIVKTNSVNLIVPTVDLDLYILAANKAGFNRLGCQVLISSPDVINVCRDKRKTYRFLVKNGFDTPEVMTPRAALAKKSLKYPCFLKPWDGSASRGNTIVHNRGELAFYGKKIPNCIVQQFVSGTEYTCDVFVDTDMKVRCVVPRKRIEVRAGEVSKGQVVKNRYIMNRAAELVETLGAGPGVITIQMILDSHKKLNFIEINPRFGGGVPLSIEAGANFPKWILQQFIGQKLNVKFDGFEDKLTMLRYDAEVWLKNSPDKR
ncbi:ATP-grasp domain-containing protein [bacterium]|nr:MAG: ATP-grasp domain-containing protein [bacterium]